MKLKMKKILAYSLAENRKALSLQQNVRAIIRGYGIER